MYMTNMAIENTQHMRSICHLSPIFYQMLFCQCGTFSGYLCNTTPRDKPCQFKLHEDPSTKDKNNLHLKVLAGTVFDPFLQNREPRSQLPIEK